MVKVYRPRIKTVVSSQRQAEANAGFDVKKTRIIDNVLVKSYSKKISFFDAYPNKRILAEAIVEAFKTKHGDFSSLLTMVRKNVDVLYSDISKSSKRGFNQDIRKPVVSRASINRMVLNLRKLGVLK